jgi:hypothetical protein
MISSRHFRNFVAAGLVVLFAAAALCQETMNELSGGELLRMMRQKDGVGTRPSYSQREAEAKRRAVADANAKLAAEPIVKEGPPGPEKPATLAAEPEQTVKPSAIVTKPAEAAKPASDGLLKMVPADSLFCVRVNNFDYTVSMIDQFLAGATPVPLGASMLVRMQLANVLGSPQLNGVNMGGSFAAFGTLISDESTPPNPADIFIGVCVPVTDYKQFIDGNPNCRQPDEKGISKIASRQAPAMLTVQVANYALVTPNDSADNYNRLIATAKSISDDGLAGLADVLDAAQTQQAKNEPLWLYGNMQLASRIFGPALLGKIEEMKNVIESMEASAPGTQPKNIQNTMNIYAGILEALMKETKSVSLTINPKPNVLNITETISAVPDTNMANMFVSDASAQQENRLLEYLEDGAAINFGSKMNTPFSKTLVKKCIELFVIGAGQNMAGKDIAKMRAIASDGVDALDGAMVCSFSTDAKNKPPFTFKFFIEAKDTDKFNKFNEFIEEAMDFLNVTDSNSLRGMMYGGKLNHKKAIVDGLWVCSIGSNVDSVIHELIDKVKAGTTKEMANEIKTALSLLPDAEKADFVCTFNLLRLFKLYSTMIPMPMPQMDIPTKSNIAFAGKVGDGKMTISIAIPKEHLTEIVSAVMMMQQQMTQQMPMPAEPAKQPTLWTCPMHPQVQQKQKGLCPVCGRELVPVQKQRRQKSHNSE